MVSDLCTQRSPFAPAHNLTNITKILISQGEAVLLRAQKCGRNKIFAALAKIFEDRFLFEEGVYRGTRLMKKGIWTKKIDKE